MYRHDISATSWVCLFECRVFTRKSKVTPIEHIYVFSSLCFVINYTFYFSTMHTYLIYNNLYYTFFRKYFKF